MLAHASVTATREFGDFPHDFPLGDDRQGQLLLMAVIAAASLFTTAAIDSRALLHATLPLGVAGVYCARTGPGYARR